MTEPDAVAEIIEISSRRVNHAIAWWTLPDEHADKAKAWDTYLATTHALEAAIIALVRERDLMRPVMEAAVAYKTTPHGLTVLLDLIDAYVAAIAPPDGEN